MTNLLIDTLQLKERGVISLIGAGGKTSLMFRLAKELADSGKNVLTTTTTKIFMPNPDESPVTIIEADVDVLIKKSKSYLAHYHHFSACSERDSTTGKLNGFALNTITKLWMAGIFDWIIVEADGAKRKPLKATDTHEPVVPSVSTHLIHITGLDAVGKSLDDKHVHRAGVFSDNTGLGLGKPIDEHAIATSIGIEVKKATALRQPTFNTIFLNKADTPDKIASGRKIAGLLQTNQNINQIITASLKDEISIKDSLITQKNKPKETK